MHRRHPRKGAASLCEYLHSAWTLFSVKETENAVIANELKNAVIANLSRAKRGDQ
jgi:hypothetical protein